MIELPTITETRIIQAARESGLIIASFFDRLLEQYQLDCQDYSTLNKPQCNP